MLKSFVQKTCVFFFAIVFVGCSAKQNTATLTLNAPALSKVSAASDDSGSFVIVNITGSDFDPIVREIDYDGSASGQQISFTVAKGSQRLIQVLAGNKSSSSTAMYYGDLATDISADTINATIDLSAVTTIQGDAQISGRYLRADGSGPSGVVDILFHPVSGRRSMIVGRTVMFSGWFTAFTLWDAKFDYVMDETQEQLFIGANASDASYASTFAYNVEPKRNMLIELPEMYRTDWSHPNDPTAREHEQKRRLVYGFFGSSVGTLGKAACYNGTSSSLSNVYDAATAVANAINWNPSSTQSTDARVVQNGSYSDVKCESSAYDFVDNIRFREQQIMNRDKLLGFQGPYRLQSYSSGVFSDVSYSNGSLSLDWAYLPGVDSVLTGSTVYYRTGHTQDDRSGLQDQDSILCNNIPSDFVKVGDYDTATTSTSFALASSFVSSHQFQVLVCPYRDTLLTRKYFDAGMIVDTSGVTISDATNIVAFLDGQTYSAGSGVTGSPNVIQSGANLNVYLYAVNSMGVIDTKYNGPVSTFAISGGLYTTSVMPSNFTNGVATVTAQFSKTAGPVVASATSNTLSTGYTGSFFVEPSDFGAPQIRVFSFNIAPSATRCEAILITFAHATQNVSGSYIAGSIPTAAALTLSLTDSSTGVTFYADPACAGASTNSISVAAGTRAVLMGVKYSSLTTKTFYVSASGYTSASLSNTTINSYITASAPSIVAPLDYSSTTTWIGNAYLGTCEAFAVGAHDSTGTVIPTAAVTFTASSSVYDFYTDSNCRGTATTSFTIPSGVPAVIFYGRAKAVGNSSTAFLSSSGLTNYSLSGASYMTVFSQ